MSGLLRKAINDEATKHTFPEEFDYRAGIRYGGAVAERVLRSDETVDAVYAATETLWETDGFGPDDMIRAVLAVLAGNADG